MYQECSTVNKFAADIVCGIIDYGTSILRLLVKPRSEVISRITYIMECNNL